MSDNIPSNEMAPMKRCQNEISKGNDIPSIPLEVIGLILLNLQVPTLLQFAFFICRDWYSLITSSNFILRYSDQAAFNSRNHFFLVVTGSGIYAEIKYFLHKNNRHFSFSRKLKNPYFFCSLQGRMVGTSNGLICLTNGPLYTYTLWNPAVRRYVHLPKLLNEDKSSVGFGFDPRINDFKVVCLVGRYNLFGNQNENEQDSAWVFSYKTWSWKQVVGDILSNNNPRCTTQVFINGVFHWIASNIEGGKLHYFIRTFDLADEVFGKMLLHVNIDTALAGLDYVGLDSVSLLATEDSIAVSLKTASRVWSVWVMKQYKKHESWTNIIMTDKLIPEQVFHISNNHDIILKRQDGKIVRYNPATLMTSVLALGEYGILCVTPYVESLYLLEKRRDVQSY